MKVHLVDGTYELFRAYFAVPKTAAPDGQPVGAVIGLIQTLLALLRQDDVTHVAAAFDHVVESFRNDLFAGYKTGEGVPQDLLDQFELAERATASLGVVVWPMVEYEADDAMAAAAFRWQDAAGVDQVVICSPDKDLTQVVRGKRVVCLNRQRNVVLDETGVLGKFGVGPESIPDYLALVGDSADGIPGVPGWGAKTSSMVLSRFHHIERIPDEASEWGIAPRGAASAANSLVERRTDAMLYKDLATLRLDVPLPESLADLEWRGVPRQTYSNLCAEIGSSRLLELPHRWADG